MAEKFRCLIVDDEVAAHYVLVNYIERIDTLEVAGQCYNALEAINFLHRNTVDLIFLDINMPEMTGFDLLRTLTNPPKVILTTAYTEFALESYDYGAIDYLLKPIHFPRFLKSIERFISLRPFNPELPASETKTETSFMVKVDGLMVRLRPEELLYAQSLGNYVKLFMVKHTYLATITTSELEHKLPPDNFMRVHKSYIIALDKITRFGNHVVFIEDTELPVGITYRRELADRLK
ncbi:MAG: response regulator transcription factor [Chitinophagaceae bacterium]|nr:response regulator transcription factor [Chitinophagaceae bacterium]